MCGAERVARTGRKGRSGWQWGRWSWHVAGGRAADCVFLFRSDSLPAMPPAAPDTTPPRPDLDVPAARAAAAAYHDAAQQGIGEEAAWREAVEVFALHHPAWPRPLAEREAARLVGLLILHEDATLLPPVVALPPRSLLLALAEPVRPVPLVMEAPAARREIPPLPPRALGEDVVVVVAPPMSPRTSTGETTRPATS